MHEQDKKKNACQFPFLLPPHAQTLDFRAHQTTFPPRASSFCSSLLDIEMHVLGSQLDQCVPFYLHWDKPNLLMLLQGSGSQPPVGVLIRVSEGLQIAFIEKYTVYTFNYISYAQWVVRRYQWLVQGRSWEPLLQASGSFLFLYVIFFLLFVRLTSIGAHYQTSIGAHFSQRLEWYQGLVVSHLQIQVFFLNAGRDWKHCSLFTSHPRGKLARPLANISRWCHYLRLASSEERVGRLDASNSSNTVNALTLCRQTIHYFLCPL